MYDSTVNERQKHKVLSRPGSGAPSDSGSSIPDCTALDDYSVSVLLARTGTVMAPIS